ncbi:MAG TPA: DsbA family protein, partial [Thermoflexus sp.]|nr:DsbA family protein [Thermoflexus sp.]
WPACIAIRAAFLQGEVIGERLLRRFRRAALTERRNISRRDVQEALAREVEGLDLERWRTDLENGRAERAFHEDLEECRRYGVTGFPTLLFRYIGRVMTPGAQRPVLVVGHRSYATYREILRRLAPALEEHPPRDPLTLLAEYGPLTTRELAEIYGQDQETARAEMERLEREGKVHRIPVPRGEFWQPAHPLAG